MQTQKSYAQQAGVLYLVPTPIGNLGDMTPRAIEILQQVDVIAAEDTRHTQKLLNHFEIATKQTPLHEHNWQSKVPSLVGDLLAGKAIAQVSDAGMPSISDPGKELVQAATQAGVPVIPLPGASAGITALIASGLVPQPHYFHGFLARKNTAQQKELAQLARIPATMIFYEAPHRLQATTANIAQILPDRQVVLARELTKRYEEFIRGSAQEVAQWAQDNEPRGEFVVLVSGGELADMQPQDTTADLPLVEAITQLIDSGIKPNAAIKEVAKQRGLNRQAVYNTYHGIEGDEDGRNLPS